MFFRFFILPRANKFQKFWKNSQRYIYLLLITMNSFRIFRVNVRPRKILQIPDSVRRWLAMTFQWPRHPIKNFKDFSKALIHSKKSEKIHGYSWETYTFLWIFSEILELMCCWEKIHSKLENVYIRTIILANRGPAQGFYHIEVIKYVKNYVIYNIPKFGAILRGRPTKVTGK